MPSERSTTTPMAERSAGFVGAHLGGMMKVDDDRFRVGVLAIDRAGPRAALQILHRDDRTLNRVVEVAPGSRFAVGDHHIRVVTVGERAVALRWTAEPIGDERGGQCDSIHERPEG